MTGTTQTHRKVACGGGCSLRPRGALQGTPCQMVLPTALTLTSNLRATNPPPATWKIFLCGLRGPRKGLERLSLPVWPGQAAKTARQCVREADCDVHPRYFTRTLTRGKKAEPRSQTKCNKEGKGGAQHHVHSLGCASLPQDEDSKGSSFSF